MMDNGCLEGRWGIYAFSGPEALRAGSHRSLQKSLPTLFEEKKWSGFARLYRDCFL